MYSLKKCGCLILIFTLLISCTVNEASAASIDMEETEHTTTVEQLEEKKSVAGVSPNGQDGAQGAVGHASCFNLAYRWIMKYTAETAMQAYAQINAPADTVEVSIDRKDFSIKNEDGSISAQMYYDLPYVTGSGEVSAKINAVLREDFDRFEAVIHGTDEDGVRYYVDNKPYPEDTYLNTVTAEITHNADGVLSIRYETDWFMGGVRSIDHYGMTFDLNTGELLGIRDLVKVSPDILLEQLQPRILHGVTNADDSAVDTVAQYNTLDDFSFYIRDRELWVCVPTYELGPGSAGSFEIPCEVYIAAKNPQRVDTKRLAYGETLEDSRWTIWEYEQFSEETTTYYQSQYVIQLSFAGDGDCTAAGCYWETDVVFLNAAGHYSLGPDGILSIEIIQNGETISAQFLAEAIDEDTILLTQISEEGLFFHHKRDHQLLMKCGNFDIWLG